MTELEKKADKYAYEVYSTRPLGDDPTDDEIKEAYIQGYKDAMAWHYPSKGDLPPNGGDYLVYIEYEDREYIRVGQYFGETGWYTDLGEVYGYWTPIAWMPLPLPPKENE